MKRFIVLSLVGIIFVSIVSLFMLPSHLVRWAFNSQFESQQLSLKEELRVSINPFSASLSISNLKLMHEQQTTLIALSALDLDFQIFPLFDKKLIVDKLEVDGLDLSIKVGEKGNLFLNGWNVNNFNTPSDPSGETTQEQPVKPQTDLEEPQSSALLKFISINEINLSNFTINANVASNEHSIDLSSLKLTNTEVLLNDNYQPEELSLKLEMDADYQLNDDSHPQYVSTGIIADLSPRIEWLSSGLKISGVDSDLTDESELTDDSELTDGSELKDNATIRIKPTQAVLISQDIAIALNALTLDFKKLETEIANTANAESTKVEWQLTSNIKELLAQTVSSNMTMLDVKLTQINNTRGQLEIVNESLDYEVLLGALTLNSIIAMRDEEERLPTMLDLTNVDVKNINLKSGESDELSIDKVIIGELTTNVIVSKDKSLANLYLPSTENQQQPVDSNDTSSATGLETTPNESIQKSEVVADAAKAGAAAEVLSEEALSEEALSEETSTKEALNKESSNMTIVKTEDANTKVAKDQFKLRIGEIINDGVFNLNTLDLSVDPNYRSLISVNTLNVSTIDTQNPDQVILVHLDANNNTYSKIVVKAEAQPFLKQPKHNVNINIDELDLSSISPYLSSALGYHINTGQLDSQVVANITGDKIKGEADLLLRSMDLTAISTEGEESSFSGGAISFNYALGMLKDGDGHVDLNVPFEGDLNNPSVGFSGFLSLIVKRATMSAAKDYLINTFVPYANVVNFAITAGKQALKLRFKDMILDAQESELDETQKERLGNLAKVLAKHDSTNIKMCPISVIADLKLDADVKAEALSKKSITAEQVQTLLNLAQKRAELAKTFLVKQGNIPSKRILSCTPTIDYSINGSPRLSFNET